jgi:hypothetical protein
MKNKSLTAIVIIGLLLFSIYVIFNSTILVKGQNSEPTLDNPAVYMYEDEGALVAEFAINYRDSDGDSGTVLLYIDSEEPVTMATADQYPEVGQYYFSHINPADHIDDYTEFHFSANDENGSEIHLPEGNIRYQIGDFQGWGEPPVLSNPDVYFDGDDWIFNVTYWDEDGDEADWVELYLDDTDLYQMSTDDPDPFIGQNYVVRILEDLVYDTTEFHFEALDEGGSYGELRDEGYTLFEVRDFDYSNGLTNGNGNGEGDGDGGGGIAVPSFLKDAEVVVGIIGLAALGGGTAYGVYRRKKKHGRFSELLTEMDKIYGSYKTNPKRCELELEKMRSTINDDLKKNTIDENNYSILKGRIDEIIKEIRSETMHSEVKDLPKDIEIKIKDMLIDGEITREEYDKLLPIIKGSEMATDDKEKMKKMVESWVKEDKEKGSE